MAAYKAEDPIKPDADGYWRCSVKPEKAREASNLGGSGPGARAGIQGGVSNVCETGFGAKGPKQQAWLICENQRQTISSLFMKGSSRSAPSNVNRTPEEK
ncbi:hypothetical protein [Brucella sp. IR073]|uniref:hypothetical protein n=1 Tax=unclassified Brucella TaxID=2632610 RepID=UPI003B9866AB